MYLALLFLLDRHNERADIVAGRIVVFLVRSVAHRKAS